MESDLLRLCETLQQKRDLRLIHGPTLRSGNTPDDIGKPAVDPFRRDPLLALREHVFTHDVRVMDVLGKYDLNHSYSLPPESFTAALEVLRGWLLITGRGGGYKMGKSQVRNRLQPPAPPPPTPTQDRIKHVLPPPPCSRVAVFAPPPPPFTIAKTSCYRVKTTPKLCVPPFSMPPPLS